VKFWEVSSLFKLSPTGSQKLGSRSEMIESSDLSKIKVERVDHARTNHCLVFVSWIGRVIHGAINMAIVDWSNHMTGCVMGFPSRVG
jgi:hypothetical protein